MRKRKQDPLYPAALIAARGRMGLAYADLCHILNALGLPWKRMENHDREAILVGWYKRTILNAGEGYAQPRIRPNTANGPVVRLHGGSKG